MGYQRQEILEKCMEALKSEKPFYQNKIINYRGKTTDTDEYYTEVIAEFVCQHLKELTDGIKKITRQKSYRTETHTGEYSADSNREEEIIAMKLFRQSRDMDTFFPHLGRIIDYQIPLKAESGDKAGKIDLLSYDGRTLHILELKKPDSKETMLRCILEGYTYLHTVDQEKLLSDFSLPRDTVVKASPFVFIGSVQHQEFMEDRPQLKKLMTLLDSKPFFIKENNDFYTVED